MSILHNANVLKTSRLLIALFLLIGHGFASVNAQDNGSASPKQSNVSGLQKSASPPSSSNQKVNNNNREDASLVGKCSERCSFGYGSRMRKINAQTDACQERCSVLPSVSRFMMGWECGNCADWRSSVAGFDMQLTVQAPDKFKQAFYDAAAKWKSVITGDLPSVNARGSLMKALSSCPASSMPNVVDDVFICGSVTDIDGPGRVLGMAGAEFVRRPNGLPIIGLMRFDEADVEMLVTMGSFNGVIVSGTATTTFHMPATHNKNFFSPSLCPQNSCMKWDMWYVYEDSIALSLLNVTLTWLYLPMMLVGICSQYSSIQGAHNVYETTVLVRC